MPYTNSSMSVSPASLIHSGYRNVTSGVILPSDTGGHPTNILLSVLVPLLLLVVVLLVVNIYYTKRPIRVKRHLSDDEQPAFELDQVSVGTCIVPIETRSIQVDEFSGDEIEQGNNDSYAQVHQFRQDQPDQPSPENTSNASEEEALLSTPLVTADFIFHAVQENTSIASDEETPFKTALNIDEFGIRRRQTENPQEETPLKLCQTEDPEESPLKLLEPTKCPTVSQLELRGNTTDGGMRRDGWTPQSPSESIEEPSTHLLSLQISLLPEGTNKADRRLDKFEVTYVLDDIPWVIQYMLDEERIDVYVEYSNLYPTLTYINAIETLKWLTNWEEIDFRVYEMSKSEFRPFGGGPGRILGMGQNRGRPVISPGEEILIKSGYRDDRTATIGTVLHCKEEGKYYAVTAGHIIREGDVCYHLTGQTKLGTCIYSHTNTDLPYSTDVALIEIDMAGFEINNTVMSAERDECGFRLPRDKQEVCDMECWKVQRKSRDRWQYGFVRNAVLTNKRENLHRVMALVDTEPGELFVGPGDCGALVTSLPRQGVLTVYGMFTGMLAQEADDGSEEPFELHIALPFKETLELLRSTPRFTGKSLEIVDKGDNGQQAYSTQETNENGRREGNPNKPTSQTSYPYDKNEGNDKGIHPPAPKPPTETVPSEEQTPATNNIVTEDVASIENILVEPASFDRPSSSLRSFTKEMTALEQSTLLLRDMYHHLPSSDHHLQTDPDGHETKLKTVLEQPDGHETKLKTVLEQPDGHKTKLKTVLEQPDGHETKLKTVLEQPDGHETELKTVLEQGDDDGVPFERSATNRPTEGETRRPVSARTVDNTRTRSMFLSYNTSKAGTSTTDSSSTERQTRSLLPVRPSSNALPPTRFSPANISKGVRMASSTESSEAINSLELQLLAPQHVSYQMQTEEATHRLDMSQITETLNEIAWVIRHELSNQTIHVHVEFSQRFPNLSDVNVMETLKRLTGWKASEFKVHAHKERREFETDST